VIRVEKSRITSAGYANDLMPCISRCASRGAVPAEGVRKPWTLVIGGEVGMIDPGMVRGQTRYVTLPMKHGVESFNAAIAGAILMDRLVRTLAG